jgi:SAM-dependent methyltransferase
MAFGVDPRRGERYSLRQARYDALAHDIDALAGQAARVGGRLQVLDIGGGGGSTWLHLRARSHYAFIDMDEADLDPQFSSDRTFIRRFFHGDLTKGYPDIPSNFYDVVICEQVLEHLHELELAMATIGRVVKPGGRAFVGVPIFPPPLHLARRHLVPLLDRMTGYRGNRTHVQAFSLATFKAKVLAYSGLILIEARGFRIISGGILRPLEHHRWWWAFNRWLGAKIPAACIEVQVILEKPHG